MNELEVVKYCDACGEPVVVVLTRGRPQPLFTFCEEHADQSQELDDE